MTLDKMHDKLLATFKSGKSLTPQDVLALLINTVDSVMGELMFRREIRPEPKQKDAKVAEVKSPQKVQQAKGGERKPLEDLEKDD